VRHRLGKRQGKGISSWPDARCLLTTLMSARRPRRCSSAIGAGSMPIDLNNEHAEEFDSLLSRYIEAARDITQPAVRQSPTQRERPSRRRSAQETARIREWARDHDMKVSDRGRIPLNVLEQYDLAQLRGRHLIDLDAVIPPAVVCAQRLPDPQRLWVAKDVLPHRAITRDLKPQQTQVNPTRRSRREQRAPDISQGCRSLVQHCGVTNGIQR
jgi:Lsr2